MYVVIFRAKIAELDEEYEAMANKLRDLAFSKYHCLDFSIISENGYETALSYWQSLDDIANWRNDALHKQAQEKGKTKWYSQLKVQIAKIDREYGEID